MRRIGFNRAINPVVRNEARLFTARRAATYGPSGPWRPGGRLLSRIFAILFHMAIRHGNADQNKTGCC